MSEEKNQVVTEAAGSTDQDVYKPIQASERMAIGHVFMIFVGLWVAMFSVNIGMSVGMSLSVGPAILATVLGYAISGVFGILTGLIGQRSGLPSYVLFKLSIGSTACSAYSPASSASAPACPAMCSSSSPSAAPARS